MVFRCRLRGGGPPCYRWGRLPRPGGPRCIKGLTRRVEPWEATRLPLHYVVQTRCGAEDTARKFLQNFGYRVYMPMALIERRHARRFDLVLRPFLSRVLFVEDAPGRLGIKQTPGVADFMRRGSEAIRVTDGVLDYMRCREVTWKGERCIQVASDHAVARDGGEIGTEYGAGDTVNVVGGPFFGFPAVFSRRVNAALAEVLVNVFGRSSKTVIEFEDLELAHAA